MIGECKSCDRTGVTLFRSGHCLICTETRDRFAAAAMEAILSHNAQPVLQIEMCQENDYLGGVEPEISSKVAAKAAYEYADAMMTERARNAEQHDR